jgi:hypothetical protein
MIATGRPIHTLPLWRTTDVAMAGMIDTRGRAGSPIALLRLRERDRLLRTDRRARQLRVAPHLAAERADARRPAGRQAPPLRAQRRLGPTRALKHAGPLRTILARRDGGHLGTPAAVNQPLPTLVRGPFPGPRSSWLPSPMFADQAARPLQGRVAPFPSQARFRAAAWPAVRALSTTGSPQGGNQR